jgi:hypothetical protein
MGTLMGLGQLGVSAYSAGMFSDCRLKRDIRLIERIKGIGIYWFRYKWEPKGDAPRRRHGSRGRARNAFGRVRMLRLQGG